MIRLLVNWGVAAALLWSGAAASAASGRLVKVLPQFLDTEGRHALSPSLYERDAYQAHLRTHRAEISALRFAVQWKARTKHANDLKLRLEVRGSKSHQRQPLMVEEGVKPRLWLSKWSDIRLSKTEFEELGEVVSWRVTLWDGKTQIAEQRSFLW